MRDQAIESAFDGSQNGVRKQTSCEALGLAALLPFLRQVGRYVTCPI